MPNMSWVLGRGGTILYKAMWTSAARIGQFLERQSAQPGGLAYTPFHTQQLEPRRRDGEAFQRGLERNGPRAVSEFARAEQTWAERARHRASRGSRPLPLTRKEFGVLEMLLAADGALVSAEELLEHVWDANVDAFSNIVSVTLARLRRAFFWRLREKYVIRDFHPLVFFYALGLLMSAAGLGLGIALIVLRILGHGITAATGVLVALLLIFGSQFTLFAMWFDMESNKDLR